MVNQKHRHHRPVVSLDAGGDTGGDDCGPCQPDGLLCEPCAGEPSSEVGSGSEQPVNPEPVPAPATLPADYPLHGPFTARGVKVVDVHRKTVAMCTGSPWMAQVIADALNR